MTPGLINRGETAAALSALRPGGQRRAVAPDWPLARMRPILTAAGALVLLCLACGLLADVPVARIAAAASPRVHRVAALFSALGNSNYMLAISGVLALAAYASCRLGGRWAGPAVALLGERAAFVFGTVAVSGLLAQGIKHLVGRARPKLLDTMGAFHFDLFSIKASLASFPSGHTASAFAIALALGLMQRRLAPGLLVIATLVGAARVTLGAHYVSDVVAGAALGSAVTLGLAALFARWSVAFEAVGRRVRLKGDGLVWPGLVGLARAMRQGA